MAPSDRDLVMFLALPYTEMGEGAGYKTKEGVINNFIKPAKERLATKLGRKVELVVEQDHLEPGDVIASMYEHAWAADIYIADLTGANANVFLELGVRWALREGVTVIISQNDGSNRFNVLGARVLKYGPDKISDDIDRLVQTMFNGLRSLRCDSLVLKNLPLIIIDKAKYDEQMKTIERLSHATGEDIIRTAYKQTKIPERIRILRNAVDDFPNSSAITRELGIGHKLDNAFSEAIYWLNKTLEINPNDAIAFRELGLCYSKNGAHELAVECLTKTENLEKDFDALCSLGGALRRLALKDLPEEIDVERLKEARKYYATAHELRERLDHYAGMNVCRITMLLSKWDKQGAVQAKKGFKGQTMLCRYIADERPNDYWSRFDLAEALLFSGSSKMARKIFSSTLSMVPPHQRKFDFETIYRPLKDYIIASVISGNMLSGVNFFIEELQKASIQSQRL